MKHFEILKRCVLFQGIEESELEKVLLCLGALPVRYPQDEFIVRAGERISFVGIVLSGKAVISKEDANGNRSILAEIEPAGIFGEAFACANLDVSSVFVQAAQECEICRVDYQKIITTCPSACSFHTKLIANMLALLADKIIMLNSKLDIISKRTIREKLMTFFELQKQRAGSSRFAISMNREELADFLFADRSAMSRELGKMRDEGLIRFHKNQFEMMTK